MLMMLLGWLYENLIGMFALLLRRIGCGGDTPAVTCQSPTLSLAGTERCHNNNIAALLFNAMSLSFVMYYVC